MVVATIICNGSDYSNVDNDKSDNHCGVKNSGNAL